MNNRIHKKHVLRDRRAKRVRSRIQGTAEKPRLSVHKSIKHLSVQLIDDEKSHTLAAASTYSKELRAKGAKKNKETARQVGELIGEMAGKLGVSHVIFDRGPYKYHGLLAELADGARAKGLKF